MSIPCTDRAEPLLTPSWSVSTMAGRPYRSASRDATTPSKPAGHPAPEQTSKVESASSGRAAIWASASSSIRRLSTFRRSLNSSILETSWSASILLVARRRSSAGLGSEMRPAAFRRGATLKAIDRAVCLPEFHADPAQKSLHPDSRSLVDPLDARTDKRAVDSS